MIKGIVQLFPSDKVAVPHIGWNGLKVWKKSSLFMHLPQIEEHDTTKVYFVHSFRAVKTEKNASWVLTTTNYGDYEFISSVQKGNVMATQFHPEKSSSIGIDILKGFLEKLPLENHDAPVANAAEQPATKLSKRIIAYACMANAY